MLREELQLLQEPGSYVGEVVKAMGKTKVLVKVHPEGKYVVDLDPKIDMVGENTLLFYCICFFGDFARGC